MKIDHPTNIIHDHPADLAAYPDLQSLYRLIYNIPKWTDRHAEILDYVYSNKIVQILIISPYNQEGLLELYRHIRQVAALVRTETHLEEKWYIRWQGMASVLDARLGALNG